jgi:sugar lactone lactonase YvrE
VLKENKLKLKRFNYAVATALVVLLAGCGGGGGGGGSGGGGGTGTTNPSTNQFTLGGTVYGLGNGLVVTVANGSDRKLLSANGTFTLDTKINSGTAYNLVATPPEGYACEVKNGSGTISANVSNASVVCAPSTGNQVAGQVAGLSTALKEPLAVTSDGNGNLYVADAGPHTIFKVDAAGKVSAFSGTTGKPGKADGAAGSAQFWLGGAGGLALDAQGSLFVSDGCNGEIRKVSADGSVSTLAGAGSNVCNNVTTAAVARLDGAPGVANFDRPGSLVSDGAGGVIVIDTSGSAAAVRMVSSAGVTTTKTYAKPVTGDFTLQRIARAPNGTLYFSDANNRIWRDTGTSLALVAGRLEGTGSADGTGLNARFSAITGMVVLPSGDMYVSDLASVRKVTAAGVVSTLAGNNANRGYANGTGASAVFGTLLSITYDGKNLIVVDSGQEILRKIDPATGVVTTVFGTPALRESVDGPGIAARFGSFSALAAGTDGNLYMVDPATNLVRMATTAGVVTTIAGKAGKGTADGALAAATFDTPNRIAAGKDGSLWVAQSTGLRRIKDNVVSTPDKDLKPVNLAVDVNNDAIVVTGTNSSQVLRVTPAGVRTTLVTQADIIALTGVATAKFTPQSVVVDAAGNIYIADTGTAAVYKRSPAGQLSVFAGTPLKEAGNIDGPVGTATLGFYEIDHLAIDAQGNLYLSGQGSVRKINPSGVVSSPSFGWGNADIGAVTVLNGKLYGMTRYALLESAIPQ